LTVAHVFLIIAVETALLEARVPAEPAGSFGRSRHSSLVDALSDNDPGTAADFFV